MTGADLPEGIHEINGRQFAVMGPYPLCEWEDLLARAPLFAELKGSSVMTEREWLTELGYTPAEIDELIGQ